ncbi:protein of unknown function [Fictibacillus solisalsi]|uniref:DUF3899 domain-containing protein n=1 Tax=Fictibacillus solisalsi TaxID=459525 RepID=A0A1G9TEM4_9BACL|nr:DUF3899 domain-containing protein [Fictibacillus solisalsi]SDM46028.1 protein of unknown function [Fictibacillus solisalsi]
MKFLTAVLLSAGAWLIYMNAWKLDALDAVNQSFILGLCFLAAGASAVVLSSGFLSPLKRALDFVRMRKQHAHSAVRMAQREMEASLAERKPFLASALLGIGTGFSTVSILLLMIQH